MKVKVTTNEAGRPTFEAFGELKTVEEWLADARCLIDKSTLEKRIFRGWGLQEALATPSLGHMNGLKVVHGNRPRASKAA
jgi:hypothetical protein